MSEPTDSNDEGRKATRKHIRGSSILLSGRFISLGLNFLLQILTVRYLSKSDYGAFAYALIIVSMGSSLTLWSMDKTVSRYLPIYDERKEFAKLRGAIIVTFGSILVLGAIFIIATFLFQDFLLQNVINDQLTLNILLIMIALSPVQALDEWFQSMFAVFANPRAIFFRRYLLGPGLKMLAVIIVIVLQQDVMFLAVSYVISGIIGILFYVSMFLGLMRDNPNLKGWLTDISFPLRDIYGFSTPMMYSDVVYILRNNAVLILVGFFHGTVAVAEYRAVVPVARLNEVVLQSFTFLFIPLAARMFANKAKDQINDLYWQTALWISLFSFPVFSVTFSLSGTITPLLFGEEYASSSVILALLALGYYFHAALGFNNHTLRVYGVVRYIMFIDFIAAIVAIGLSLVFIPLYGALGGAISASGTLIVHNILNHIGLSLYTDVQLFNKRYLLSYVMIIAGALTLLIMQLLISPPIYISLPIAGAISLFLIWINRELLDVANTFPELLKIKPLRIFLKP